LCHKTKMTDSVTADDLGLKTGDLNTQWKWHETFRDSSKNMYRTTYTDMIHGREVSVRSDYPSGYGGHVPSLRHDILFRNEAFDRTRRLQMNDESRDSHPDFKTQITGTGGSKVFKSLAYPDPKRPPWAVTPPIRQPPTFRTTPFRGQQAKAALTGRSNDSSSDAMSKTMPCGFQY